ncbi:hypothetical protein SAMN05661012_01003 [Chitinophaga sancti]|uniref:Uncharacterized protein n=1 Tax=Chitinophaga sancti TaxID=1004 RepID=A0A1K1MYP5_9BACT|nr:hypothetical protein SAMN05661012_01003 [Chitinophaga sancti]
MYLFDVILILAIIFPFVAAYFISRSIYRKVRAAGKKGPVLYRVISFVISYLVIFAVFVYLVLMNLRLER